MLITVDRDSPESLQEQIFSRIRQQIVTGILRPGSPIPSSRIHCATRRLPGRALIPCPFPWSACPAIP